MKITKGMLYSTLLIGALVVSAGQVTHAASYPDALKVITDGVINITEEDDDTIPKPDDPDKPVIPDEKDKNPKPGDLKLVAVTSFDFGQHKKSITGMNAFAKQVHVTDPDNNADLYVVPYVTTKDMRVDRGEGWHLTAEAAKFTAGSHTIDGAQISFVAANYAKGNTTNESNRPTVALDGNGNIDLIPEKAVPIASSDTSKNPSQGIGLYTLALGTKLADDSEDVANNGQVTDGVKFTLPINTAVNTDKYSTTIIWTLAPGI